MYRSLFHIALIFMLLLSGMNYSVIQTHFYLHRADLAAAFCDNLDRPELACNGSCELGRRLADAKEQDAEKERVSFKEIHLHYTLTDPQVLDPVSYRLASLEYPSRLASFVAFEIGLNFFHPPRTV